MRSGERLSSVPFSWRATLSIKRMFRCPESPDLDTNHVFQPECSQGPELSPKMPHDGSFRFGQSVRVYVPVPSFPLSAMRIVFTCCAVYSRLSGESYLATLTRRGRFVGLYAYTSNRFTLKFPMAKGLCEFVFTKMKPFVAWSTLSPTKMAGYLGGHRPSR